MRNPAKAVRSFPGIAKIGANVRRALTSMALNPSIRALCLEALGSDAADAGPAACGAPHDNDDLGDYGNPGHGYRVGLGEFDQTAELASAGGT